MNSRMMLRKLPTILCACLAFSVAATGCAPSHNDPAVISQANQFNTAIAPAEMKNATLDQYFQALGARIVAAAQQADRMKIGPKSHFQGDASWMFQNIRFYLVSSKTLNAFTTGGHDVYIYNELFQLCQNESQLAAVMSHEFAHIYCRHVQKGMTTQTALAVFATAVGAGGSALGGTKNGSQYAQLASTGAGAVAQFASMGFTRSDEAQADQYGQIFYTIAGWDPAHFGDFFRVMKAKVGDVTTDLTSDHPSLTSRYEIADKRAPALERRRPSPPPPPVASPEQFKREQQLAMQVAASTPEDTKVLNTKKLLQALPRSCWIPTQQPDQLAAQQQLIEAARQQQQKQQSAK